VPPIVSLAVKPGGTSSEEITLHAGILETVNIEADGLGQQGDGSFSFVTATDPSPYSGRSMVSFRPATILMQPNTDQKVNVSVAVPTTAGSGTRYALIRITATPGAGTQNVGIGVELGVPALITLANTPATHTGALGNLKVDATAGQPLVVSGQIANTGNTHFGASPNQINASAVVYDSSNKDVGESRTTLEGNSLVPTFSRDFSLTVAAAKNLSAGKYRVEVTAILQDGTVLDKQALSFDFSGGEVLGVTGAPVQGAAGNSSSSGGSDASMLLMAGLGGLLIGAFFVAIVAVMSRRRRFA
jgi:methionine-rich copper-binding protein CopC